MIPLIILDHPTYTTLLCVFLVLYLENGQHLFNNIKGVKQWFKK